MTWLQRYRLRNYFRNSIWIAPFLGIVAAILLCRLVYWIDKQMGLNSNFDPGATRSLLETLASATFTLIVFVSSALLLAIQLASAQLTPRVISFFFRDTITKLSLTLFTFTFTFSLAVAVRISGTVPVFAVRTAAFACLLSLAFFVFLIDHVGKFLRPSGVLRLVTLLGRQVIESVYPDPFRGSINSVPTTSVGTDLEPFRTIGSSRGGVILALDVPGLVSLAEKFDCVIEMIPQVGDFVAAQEPLFRVFNGGAALPDKALHDSVAVGSERTIEQDPELPFRILVDIASKGLSAAINDPTTAVLAIDQIHRLLRYVGLRNLDEGNVRDSVGHLRLIFPTPDWEDFVYLAVTEIRHYGSSSIQVSRRLKEMLDNLIETLPPARTPILREELGRLQRSVERSFPESDDRLLAEVCDSLGVGGNRVNSQT